jgi:hypothetical protein
VRAARLKGHEVLLAVPMEPEGYPKNDPGEQTLLTSNTAARNLALLKWSMSRFSGYVGIVAHEGGRFLGSPEHLRPVLGEVKARGLMFVDPSQARTGKADKISAELGLPVASVTAIIDDDPAPVSITARLNAVAAQARTDGRAVVLGRPYPATITAVKHWLASFRDRDLTAAPITVVAETALRKAK